MAMSNGGLPRGIGGTSRMEEGAEELRKGLEEFRQAVGPMPKEARKIIDSLGNPNNSYVGSSKDNYAREFGSVSRISLPAPMPSRRDAPYAGGKSMSDRLSNEAIDSREEKSSYDIFVDYMEKNIGRKEFPEIYSSYIIGGGVELNEDDKLFSRIEYEVLLQEKFNGGSF